MVGAQYRYHCSLFACQRCQEFRCHALAIHDDAFEARHASRLLIVREYGWQPYRQMLVSPMGSDEQGVTFLIMQDYQSTRAQNFSRAPNQPTWD